VNLFLALGLVDGVEGVKRGRRGWRFGEWVKRSRSRSTCVRSRYRRLVSGTLLRFKRFSVRVQVNQRRGAEVGPQTNCGDWAGIRRMGNDGISVFARRNRRPIS